MRTRILSYKLTSESAKSLAGALNTKQIRPDGNYKYQKNDVIINLGCSVHPKWDNDDVIWFNKPEAVAIAVCKKKTFFKLKEHAVAIPQFTESRDTAKQWIQDGNRVACRTILNGHSAAGLVVAHSADEMPQNTKLYVKYFPKKTEYRVHLIRDKEGIKIFDFIAKKLKSDLPKQEEVNYEIRNHGQWIFAREGVELPNCVKVEAIKAMNALGMDLGSVDVCYQSKNDTCAILELNSCSSLSGETTLTNYAQAIQNVLEDKVVNKVVVKMPKAAKVVVPAIAPKDKKKVSDPVPPAAPVYVPPPPMPKELKKELQQVLEIEKPKGNVNEVVHVVLPPAPKPAVKDVNKKYSFKGVSDIEIIESAGGLKKFYGRVHNVPNPVKIMEMQGDKVTFFWED